MRLRNLAIPTGVAVVHALFCYAIEINLIPSEGGWKWFFPFLIDLPLSLVFPLFKGIPPVILFGLAGSVWWGGVSYWFIRSRSRIRSEGSNKTG